MISQTTVSEALAAAGPDWLQPIRAEMALVEDDLRALVPPDMPIAAEAFGEAIQAGGKRLRPAVCLLAAGATGGIDDSVMAAATVMEVVHLASLMHDDVVDDAELRRGMDATRVRWGNRASVLVGDLLAAEAYRAVAIEVGPWATPLLCEAVLAMCNGQFMHATSERGRGGEAQYVRIIRGKTGALFEAACEMGARASGANNPCVEALRAYGMSLGIAFQIVDDLLDLYAAPEDTGKPLGNDLRTAQYTLPLIAALRHEQANELHAALEQDAEGLSPTKIRRIASLADALGGREYAARRAEEFADKATRTLTALRPSAYRDALEAACADVLARIP